MKKALKQILKVQRYLKRYDVNLKITGMEEACTQKEDKGVFKYPETIEITIENWSTSHYSVRTKDLCWIRSGQNLNRTNHIPAWKVFRMHLREIKAFAEHKAKIKSKELDALCSKEKLNQLEMDKMLVLTSQLKLVK